MPTLREDAELLDHDEYQGQNAVSEIDTSYEKPSGFANGNNHWGHLEETLYRIEMQLAALQDVPEKLNHMRELPRQVQAIFSQTSLIKAQVADMDKHIESDITGGKHHHHHRGRHHHALGHHAPHKKARDSNLHPHGQHTMRHGHVRSAGRQEAPWGSEATHMHDGSLDTLEDMVGHLRHGRREQMSVMSYWTESRKPSAAFGFADHRAPEQYHSDSRAPSLLYGGSSGLNSAGLHSRDHSFNCNGSLLGHSRISEKSHASDATCNDVPVEDTVHAGHAAFPGHLHDGGHELSTSRSCGREMPPDLPKPDASQTFEPEKRNSAGNSFAVNSHVAHRTTTEEHVGDEAPCRNSAPCQNSVSLCDNKQQCSEEHLQRQSQESHETAYTKSFSAATSGTAGKARFKAQVSFDDPKGRNSRASTFHRLSRGFSNQAQRRATQLFSLATANLGLNRSKNLSRNIDRMEPERKWILFPNSVYRLVWDAFAILCIVFAGTVVPLQLVYFGDKSMSPVVITTLFILDAVWPIDILLNFFTGFYSNGVLVSNKWPIAVAYAKQWLLPDLITSCPLAFCGPLGSTWFTVVALLKLSRVLQIGRRLGNIRAEYQELRLMSIYIVILLFLISHFSASLWRVVLRSDGIDESGEDWFSLYVADQYWVLMTMTTIGYGDISPSGTVSRLYAMAVMFVASALFGAIVSGCAHITNSLFNDPSEQKVEEVTRFMRRRQVDRDLQRRVQCNLRTVLRYQKLSTMDPDLLTLLSPAMQRELSLALLSSTVLKFPLFKGAQRSFVAEMAQAHSWEQVLQGDLVAEEGHLITEIVFVMLGCLEATVGDEYEPFQICTGAAEISESIQTGAAARPTTVGGRRQCFAGATNHQFEIKGGAWFGEACFFDANRIYTATIVANEESELASLAAKDYFRIVQRYPRLWERHQVIEKSIISGQTSLKDLAYKETDLPIESEQQSKFSFSNWLFNRASASWEMTKVVPSSGSGERSSDFEEEDEESNQNPLNLIE